jgi:hypothetical protein
LYVIGTTTAWISGLELTSQVRWLPVAH